MIEREIEFKSWEQFFRDVGKLIEESNQLEEKEKRKKEEKNSRNTLDKR